LAFFLWFFILKRFKALEMKKKDSPGSKIMTMFSVSVLFAAAIEKLIVEAGLEREKVIAGPVFLSYYWSFGEK
jgi:hypothetical protein